MKISVDFYEFLRPYLKDVPNLLFSWLQQEAEQVGFQAFFASPECEVLTDPNQNLLEQKAGLS